MRHNFCVVGLVLAAACGTAYSDLKTGVSAPTFSAPASLGGTVSTFNLAEALKSGPVVLYFYPAAFTKGCTIEAHDFADAVDRFKALGATVIGISHDDIETLKKFSVSDCRSRFAVAADPDLSIAKSYDAILAANPKYANRTSYVITPDGQIIYSFTNMNPEKHVENTLQALKDWSAKSAP